jgi:hypothetical protein
MIETLTILFLHCDVGVRVVLESSTKRQETTALVRGNPNPHIPNRWGRAGGGTGERGRGVAAAASDTQTMHALSYVGQVYKR